MRVKIKNKAETYEFDGGFRVDIVETSDTYEAWLYHKDAGIKSLIIGGVPKNKPLTADAIAEDLAESIESYKKLYMY